MLPDEARKFFIKSTGRKNLESSELKALDELISELDYLPPGVEQAGAYIRNTKCSFEAYLYSYKKHGFELLEQFKVEVDNYPESVAITWLLNFEKVGEISKASTELLFASAFLNSPNIPSEIFIKGAKELGPVISSALKDVESAPRVLDEILELLAQYSLITRDTELQTYDVHSPVQVVLRDEMDESTQHLWAERVVKAVNLAFPEIEYKNWELCERLLPQAQICAEHIKLWGIETEESAKLLNASGKYLHKRARFKESELLLTGSLEIRKKVLGPKHLNISGSLVDLAELYKDLGRHSKAESLSVRALEIREKVLNPDDPAIAESLNNLALIYKALGRYSDAELLFIRALKITENFSGPDHPDVGIRLSNLAGVYSELGRYSDAEPLCVRALKITENALGPDHPDVGVRLNNLALVYSDLGRHSEAELLCTRALEITENSLGPDHPTVGTCLNNLAAVYSDMGHYSDAEPLCVRALEITETSLGPDHPDVGTRLNNLAAVYKNLGRYSDAEPLYTRALEIIENSLGPDHPTVVACLNNLAAFYYDQNKYLKARSCYERSIKIMENTGRENSLDFAALLEKYAYLLMKRKKNREAIKIYNRAKGIRSKIEKGKNK